LAIATRPPTAVFLAFAPAGVPGLVDLVLTSRSRDMTLEIRIYACARAYLFLAAHLADPIVAVDVVRCRVEDLFAPGTTA